RLECNGAREAAGAQRIDGMRADMRADVDEYRIGTQPPRRRQDFDRAIDLAALPAAVPHQPGADDAVARVDEEADIVELAQHEMPARGERIHHHVTQHGPTDEKRLKYRLAQRTPAPAIGTSDLAPGRPCCQIRTPLFDLPDAPWAAPAGFTDDSAHNGALRARAQFGKPSFCPCRIQRAAP